MLPLTITILVACFKRIFIQLSIKNSAIRDSSKCLLYLITSHIKLIFQLRVVPNQIFALYAINYFHIPQSVLVLILSCSSYICTEISKFSTCTAARINIIHGFPLLISQRDPIFKIHATPVIFLLKLPRFAHAD